MPTHHLQRIRAALLPVALAAAVPTLASAADVAPDPVSAASSPFGATVLAVVALAVGVWVIRRRKR
ncbi:MAG: hypothetical protein IT361_00645 [Gemmatimonadaceae bacterium]|nr:hypothetical protein [Gemmatimonadaceae bacterium]